MSPITTEAIIEPDLPIVDAHHHLWVLSTAALEYMDLGESIYARTLAATFHHRRRYLFDDFTADLTSGHNVRASVFVESHAMYRSAGPEPLRSVGEVEFANGVAAMAASGLFGDARVCAGIVGGVDLTLGEAVEEVLAAHIQAGGDRYRGVRSPVVHDDDATILGAGDGVPGLLVDRAFRAGFSRLRQFGLSLDVFLFEPQLPQLVDLAHSFPETPIILNHAGSPVGVGRYAGKRAERFPLWRESMRQLSDCTNVVVKLGGLGIPFAGFESFMAVPPATSMQLAAEWKPYIETCIELFGVDRCMFESNFPVDSATASYRVLWNAFKRIAMNASASEKTALFSGTASRIYRLAGTP